jgi:gliding motility-associated-like protein
MKSFLFIPAKMFLCATVFLMMGATLVYSQPSWVAKDTPPTGVYLYDPVSFVVGTKGYALDAYNGFWEYDPANTNWVQKAPYPGYLGWGGGKAAFAIGSKGYVGLGFGPGDQWLKEFWEYDPATNVWTRKADFGGNGREAAVGFSIGSLGYVGVGFSGGRNSVPAISAYQDFWEYNPATNSWTRKADFAGNGSIFKAGFATNTKGYVGLGQSSNEFWEYNPGSNTWVRKADYPGGVGGYEGTNALVINDKGYLGLGSGGNPNFFEYNPANNAWTRLADFPAIIQDEFDPTQFGQGRVKNIAFSFGSKGYLGQGQVRCTPNYYCGNFGRDFWEFNPQNEGTSCIPPEEKAALTRLYGATKGASWKNKWTGNDESTWYGVTISGCHVTELKLEKNNLQGNLNRILEYLPFLTKINLSGNALTGPLPDNIFTTASEIDLSENNFNGSLPTNFGSALVAVNLSNNQLTGTIPSGIGTSTLLQSFDISNNLIDGTIPTEIGNLLQAETINLSNNKIIGSLPAELGLLTSLKFLNLSGNKFSGTIPNLESLGLSELNLSNNQLSGDIPGTLAFAIGLFPIKNLDVSNNLLTGALPDQFSGIYFDNLNLSHNKLTALRGLAPVYPTLSIGFCDVTYNQLDFADLEANYNAYRPDWWNGYVSKFKYSPQSEIDRVIVNSTVGASILFSPTLTPTASTFFQWYKNGVLIPGATLKDYSLPSVQASDAGIYTLKVSSSIIWDLVIEAKYLLQIDPGTGSIPVAEREALLWFYYSTNGSNWSNKTNWLSADESTWAGVTVTSGHVTQLSGEYNFLTGSLPTELGNLPELEYLYIRGNYSLTGSIPPSLGNLTKLKQLDLSYNSLSGVIPASLGKLSELISLDISGNFNLNFNNSFSGSLPPELGNLTKLTYLAIDGDNNLTAGPIPSSFSRLTNLYSLKLDYCNITGEVPISLIQSLSLGELSLSNNQLSGTLPIELRKFQNINLSHNQLTGTLPISLGTAGSSIGYLDLSYNLLLGTIPTALSTWDNIYGLTLRGNDFTGVVPVELGDMNEIGQLDLGENELTGTIPVALSNANNLNSLSLDNNQLTGTIPKELGSLNLTSLQLNNNQLTGTLPLELSNAVNLYNLRLNNNQLSGPIPTQYGLLTNLSQLYLNDNLLTGPLPSGFGNFNKLNQVSLANNQLTGTIPAGMGSPTYLYELSLNNNQFTGALPNYFGSITNIYYIRLQDNQFTDIPAFAPSFMYELSTQNNLLDFGDLELNTGKTIYFGYSYTPQNTVLAGGNVNSTVGCPLTIPFTTPGTANKYQWYKDGVLISGATAKEFTLASGYASDAGNYSVNVTNTKLPGLTLTSAPWIVTIGGTPLSPPTAVDASACSSTSLVLTASGAIGAQQYRWYDVPTGGSSLASSSSFTTPVLTTSKSYYVTIFDPAGGCESIRKEIIAKILDIAPTTIGASSCGSAVTITLSATGGTNGQYRWYTNATGGSAIVGEVNSSFSTPLISTSTTYYVSINNGVCESPRAPVTATVSSITVPVSTSPPPKCTSSTFTLTATGATGTQEYRWYDVATGGTSLASTASFATPSITATKTYYVSVFDVSGLCESVRTPVDAVINPIPTSPIVTAGSGCVNTTITLSASGGSAGQYRWYEAATGGTASSQVDANFNTTTLTTSTTYYVSLVLGGCESPRSPVVAMVINVVPPSAIGSSSCSGNTVTLNASGGTAGQYRWYTTATGGTVIPGETNSSYTTPSISATTIYYAAVNNGTCESNRTPVTATINPIPTAPTLPVNGSSCGTAAVTVSVSGGTIGQYRWYTLPTGGTAIPGETNSSYTTPSISATTNYYAAINNGTCESTRTLVTATTNPIPTAPTLPVNGSSCGTAAVTVSVSGGTNGQYRWYTALTGGTPIPGETNSSYTTPSISVPTSYYAAINNGTCESTRTQVTATTNPIPTAPTLPVNGSSCGAGTVTVSVSGGTNGQYRWYTALNGGTPIPGETNSSYTTPSISAPTSYYAAINNGTCESTRTSVTANVINTPAPTTTGSSICPGSTVTLTATGGANGQYKWYAVATGGTPITGAVNGSFTTAALSITTTFYVTITANGCESARTPVTATVNTSGCAPSIPAQTYNLPIEGKVEVDLKQLITTSGILDVNTIKIIKQPASGASASIVNGVLIIDYKGKPFVGREIIVIEACTTTGQCSQQTFEIDVAGDIVVFNGISPNGDGLNDFLTIQNIELLPETKNNTVMIYSRWGDEVFKVSDYNNADRVFKGDTNSGSKLPAGTYFYKIVLPNADKTMTGFISIKN